MSRRDYRHIGRHIAYGQRYRCAVCSTMMLTWEIDHVVALCNGGADHPDNLQAICPNCHSVKTKWDRYARANPRTSPYFDPGHPRCTVPVVVPARFQSFFKKWK